MEHRMAPPPLKDPRFTGVFTAIITPFTDDGASLHLANLREQIEFQAAGGVRGIVINGTTGESPTLDHDELHTLAKEAIAHARRLGLLAILGTGSNSTSHAVANQRLARELGADAALSVNPYYNKPTQEGLYRHFMAVADAAPLPVMLYNIPGRTGVALAPVTVERLAAHPNIVAVKEATASMDSASEIALRCPSLALLSGDDSMTLPMMAIGGVGVVSVIANIVPRRLVSMCNAAASGRWSDAADIHRELFSLCRAMFAETNPIPLKAAMKLLKRDTGSLRLPMCEASPETGHLVRKALEDALML